MLFTTIAFADYILLLQDFKGDSGRINKREDGKPATGEYTQRPNPAGPYEGIKNQDKNQQQEANLTNQQDTYNKDKDGKRVPLWPCRAAPVMDNPNVFQ